jgi:hypothetical protein
MRSWEREAMDLLNKLGYIHGTVSFTFIIVSLKSFLVDFCDLVI